jgi:hypothetical protein
MCLQGLELELFLKTTCLKMKVAFDFLHIANLRIQSGCAGLARNCQTMKKSLRTLPRRGKHGVPTAFVSSKGLVVDPEAMGVPISNVDALHISEGPKNWCPMFRGY